MKPAFVLLLIASAGCDDGGPHLASVMPARASRDTMITITGERFCGGEDCHGITGEVLIGLDLPQVQGIVLGYGDTFAMVQIPTVTPVGATDLILVVDGTSSNALSFEVLE